VNTFQEYLSRDRFSKANNIELVECRPGYAKTKVTITDSHLNGADVVHGGLLFTLADYAFAAAVNSYGIITLSINASISYFEKRSSGILTAEAKEISRSRKLCVCDINITDESNNLIANFKGTAYITGTEIQ
jgi:acyl-CoA thioesterase